MASRVKQRREVLSESRMREICTSGSMSGDGKRGVAEWPKLPRPSSTLPKGRTAPAPPTGSQSTCPWRIRKLRCDRHLEQTAAMVPPCVMVKSGMGGRRLARSFSRSAAAERLVNAIVIVIISELFQLSPQVDSVPDQHVVKKLPSYRPDQPFHERMGHRYERDRLNLLDL